MFVPDRTPQPVGYAARAMTPPATPSSSAATSRSAASGSARCASPATGIWGEPPDPAGRPRAAAPRRPGRRQPDRHRRLLRPRGVREPDRRGAPPLSRDLVIATKGGLERPGPGRAGCRNGRPDRLRRCCEASLRRLKLERIDLYQLHAVDPKVPIEDSVGALAELQEEGKIRHDRRVQRRPSRSSSAPSRSSPIVSVQNRYNVADRAPRRCCAVCEQRPARVPAVGPARHGGDLAKPRRGAGRDRPRARRHARQVALAWLLAHSPVIAADPGHELDRALRGEPRGRPARARRRRARGARRARARRLAA